MQPTNQIVSFNARVFATERPLLVNNVARITGLCESAVRWNARHGFLKGFRDPNTPKIWRFYRRDVESFLKSRRVPCLN
jgi:hypothetical protein